MIERTPQEIADFFGCYVFEAETEGDFYVTKQRPIKDCDCYVIRAGDEALGISSEFIRLTIGHYQSRLYEPHGKEGKTEEDFPNPDNKSESCYSDQADSDNNPGAPKEYAIVEGKRTQDLAGKVNVMLNHGWKPQGGIAVEYLPESDGYKEGSEIFYQAMVKGVYMGFPDSAGL